MRFGPEVRIDPSAFIHETALIYGRASIGEDVSVWPYAVIRAETAEVRIGPRTNIQDFVMIHVGDHDPTIIGEDCSITHHATLHGCSIGDACLIGINATVMDGAVIGANSIVAGHAIVGAGVSFPENSIIAGVPAKVIKTIDSGSANRENARYYVMNGKNYVIGQHRFEREQLIELGLESNRK